MTWILSSVRNLRLTRFALSQSRCASFPCHGIRQGIARHSYESPKSGITNSFRFLESSAGRESSLSPKKAVDFPEDTRKEELSNGLQLSRRTCPYGIDAICEPVGWLLARLWPRVEFLNSCPSATGILSDIEQLRFIRNAQIGKKQRSVLTKAGAALPISLRRRIHSVSVCAAQRQIEFSLGPYGRGSEHKAAPPAIPASAP
jgi:hypothetical protein